MDIEDHMSEDLYVKLIELEKTVKRKLTDGKTSEETCDHYLN